MDRRMRFRGRPQKEAYALVEGIAWPIKIVDFSGIGMSVTMAESWGPIFSGTKVKSDIVVDGKLLVCGLQGEICWGGVKQVGIKFQHRNETQVKAACKAELAMYRF